MKTKHASAEPASVSSGPAAEEYLELRAIRIEGLKKKGFSLFPIENVSKVSANVFMVFHRAAHGFGCCDSFIQFNEQKLIQPDCEEEQG